MSENYRFVSTDTDTITAELLTSYKEYTGHTVRPADPEMLFIKWLANTLVQERALINFTGNQNIPSRAIGENLDALGETIYNIKRPVAQHALCTVRFFISPQSSAIIIPAGTRVTDINNDLVWGTTADAVIDIGQEYKDVTVQCLTSGKQGNGYVAGSINKLVDVDNVLFFIKCENIDTSYGGVDRATDGEYYELMKSSRDASSVAGPSGAYEHWAKTVSPDIIDVKAVQPTETISKQLSVYENNTGRFAFLGGEQLLPNTLRVYFDGQTSPAKQETDYSFTYQDDLITIQVFDSVAANTMRITIDRLKAGCVNIYAVTKGGTPAGEGIKTAILKTCSADSKRPLTDYVSCEDPQTIPYSISLVYYLPTDSTTSAHQIENAVNQAVNDYISWQASKLGRDINPSKLHEMIMSSGVKRVDITSPPFIVLQNGKDNTIPQIASIQNIEVINGGAEDE